MSDRPKAPLTTTTSIWPAAAVLGIAVVMLAIFMVINLVADQGVATTTTTIPIVVGGLSSEPSNVLLSGCSQPGNPPRNITDAFLLPQHTLANGAFSLPNDGAGDFDCLRSFITVASANQLLAYFSTQLEARGWALFSTGSSKGSPQDLFQKAGSDTFYWDVGITVNSAHAGSTHWTYRIFQVSETI